MDSIDAAMSVQKPATFEEVVEKYSEFVYNVALRTVSDPVEAEDITQEAFIDAYRAWDRFRGESQVSTWLYRITVNRSLMRLRKGKRARQFSYTPIEDANLVSTDEGPERAAVSAELRGKLEEAIGSLPDDLRVAVVLRDVQGLSGVEAAEVLNVSVSALKARLHRGRILLREQLQDYIQAPT